MKAVEFEKYGEPEKVLRIIETEKPVPEDDQVLVNVKATSATTHNLIGIKGKPYFVRLMNGGLFKPAVTRPGSDFAGRVEAVGGKVRNFTSGDEVYGDSSMYGFGALAEFIALPEAALSPKPSNITFEEAAGVPQAAVVALQGLREKGKIERGQKVLIFGASGGIGTFAVQLAKHFGAEVTGVCSTPNLDMVRELGAERVVDYTKEDFTDKGEIYDLIFAVASRPIDDFMRALKSGGTYVSVGAPSLKRVFEDMVSGPRKFRAAGKKIEGGWGAEQNKGLDKISKLIEDGTIRPVVDRIYPLQKAGEAFRYFGEGHSRGKVIITVDIHKRQ